MNRDNRPGWTAAANQAQIARIWWVWLRVTGVRLSPIHRSKAGEKLDGLKGRRWN